MMSIWDLVLFLGLAIRVQSQTQDCGDSLGPYFNITSQKDLDDLSSACPTIFTGLIIAQNFTGPFYLPNVTNITRDIRLDWNAWPPPNVTSIELPDLLYLKNGVYLDKLANTLERFSLPSLEYTQGLNVLQYVDNAEVNLRKLIEADYLTIQGNYSKISLNSLQNVTQSLTICNTNRCGPGDYRGEGPRRAMEVSLPILEEATRTTIAGDLSSLDMPRYTSGDLRVLSENTSVKFSFLSLTHTGYALDLQGNISDLLMPSFKESAGFMSIKTSGPLNVTIPIVNAKEIYLKGAIDRVYFPYLKNASRLYIDSDLPIDCQKLTDSINGTYEGPKIKYWLSCDSTRREEPKGLSTPKKVGIGTAVGVVGLALIIGFIFWRQRRKSKRNKAIGEMGSAVELTGVTREEQNQGQGQAHGEAEEQDEPPPPYKPREALPTYS